MTLNSEGHLTFAYCASAYCFQRDNLTLKRLDRASIANPDELPIF